VSQDWNQDFQRLNGRFYPNGFYASIGWKGHNGIDYGCYTGDPIEAVCDGVIEFVGDGNNHHLLTGGGNAILLRSDALGIRFEYLHLSRFEVHQGQRVSRGQVIARSGNTGISTDPHLHLGAIPVNGVNVNNGYRGRIDPTPYLYGSMNPDYANSSIAPQGTTTTSEEIDMSAEANILARLSEIVSWQEAKFQALAAQADSDRNALAGFVRDLVLGQDTLTEAELDAKLAALSAARPATNVLVKGDASDTVYAWDGGSGYRGLGYDEFKTLIGTGAAVLIVRPQEEIDKAVGGN
jgi:hypothetical protein